ncbi:Putative ubiquitin carboxyl-terminal hydrolase 50 [Larimichthys crocea]|uniref:Uncharacterized protein n=1 Tax=Larimichthys crocea TaxID=215358 RepID=A0ACD3Q547_LARCR|nr:Putative ubiquitin carboxyl-terminal hydrolase 50 [Larimichthys crocea]
MNDDPRGNVQRETRQLEHLRLPWPEQSRCDMLSEQRASGAFYDRRLPGGCERKQVAKTHNITKRLEITNVYEQRDAAEYFEKILCRTSPEAAKMFKGKLSHKTTCRKCTGRSDSSSFFWMLPLAVEDLSRQSYSVKKGLKAFFKGETVCGDNKIYCSHCTEKQDADFRCEMTQNPEVLTLLLKRFTFDYKRRCYVKLHCKVDVPQVLHTEDCDYDLYALVNHFGNLTGGHYTAQIKSFETRVWYHFNDSIVKGVKPLFGVGDKSLRSSTAYLLMYRKVRRNHEEIEGTHEEAERGAAPVPPHQLKDESCNGGENVKHLTGDELKKTYHDATVSKATLDFSGEMPRQTAACIGPQKEMLCTGDGYKTRLQTQKSNSAKAQQTSRQLDASSNEHMHVINTRGTPAAAHCVDYMSEKNHTPGKKMSNVTVCETEKNIHRKTGAKTSVTDRSHTINGGKSEQRREAAVSPNVYHHDVKSFHISSNGYSNSPLPHLTGRSQTRSHPNEYSPDLCRISSRSNKDNAEKTQRVLTADSSCRLDHIQSVRKGETSASPRKKNAAKSTDKVKREPWRS